MALLFVDLTNSGRSDLVLATGNIPVTNLAKDAGPVKVVAPLSDQGSTQYGITPSVVPMGLRVNGGGLAVADADNNGRFPIIGQPPSAASSSSSSPPARQATGSM